MTTNILSYSLLTNTRKIISNLVAYTSVFYYLNNKEQFECKKLGYRQYILDTINPKTNKLKFISNSLVQTVNK